MILAMPSAADVERRRTACECREIGITCKTIPDICELVSGKAYIAQIRDIDPKEVLGRKEAVHLVIQAIFLSKGGEVFVLDMGEPIRIVDLARSVIRLSGFEPEKDVPIRFTGLRPGEKLHEELFTEYETVSSTAHPQILEVQSTCDEVILSRFLEKLEIAAATGHIDILMDLLNDSHVFPAT